MALPALSTGSEPGQVVSTLLDALLGTLRLAFVCVRLNDQESGVSIEMVRFAESLGRTARADVSYASARLGLRGEIGIVVAGSQKLDFPADTDMLLLNVAANQAAIGLQRRRTERALRESERAEAAHVARVTTVGALTGSIAHEVNQPLSGIITNAGTCLRMLDANPPNSTAREKPRGGRFATATAPRRSSPGCVPCSARRSSRSSRWI